MKIAYLAVNGMPGEGGVEKYTEELGSRLVSRGHGVTVYSADSRTGCYEYRGMQIVRVPALMGKGLEKLSATGLATLAAAIDRSDDIAHFHAFGPGMFAGATRSVGIKTVVQGHGLEWKRSRWGLFARAFLRAAEIPSVRVPHAVTVVSRVQQEYLANEYGIRSKYIPTGVTQDVPINLPPVSSFLDVEAGSYLLFAARLVPEKGAHHLIRAFRSLDTDLRLVLAGASRYEGSYQRHIGDLAYGDDRILFTGFLRGPEYESVLRGAYLFVQPSEIEGLSIGLLEAMAAGKGCVASDIPENIEALRGSGTTFRSGDPEDLANTLRKLLTSPERVAQEGLAAQKLITKEHDWDEISHTFESWYTGLLGDERASC